LSFTPQLVGSIWTKFELLTSATCIFSRGIGNAYGKACVMNLILRLNLIFCWSLVTSSTLPTETVSTRRESNSGPWSLKNQTALNIAAISCALGIMTGIHLAMHQHQHG